MNIDELEPDDSLTLDEAKTPNSLSVPRENEKKTVKRYRKSNSLQTRQYAIAQERASKSYRSVAEPLLYQAVHVFLSDAVITAPSGSTSKGHFANLVALIQSSSKSEALPFALEAVALASLASRICNSEVQLEATRRYTISINRLRQTNLSVNSDVLSVIACILLLSLYEVRSQVTNHVD
jgi:hypothetical protein